MKHKKYSSYTSYNDMLFKRVNWLCTFIHFGIYASTTIKKADIPKAEIMVVLDWDDMSADDVDLWIKGTGMNSSFS